MNRSTFSSLYTDTTPQQQRQKTLRKRERIIRSGMMDLSKLTLEIFAKLEQNLLNGSSPFYSPSLKSNQHSKPKTRILTIDGGLGPNGLVAAHALVHLETSIKVQTGNDSAKITDHFDLIAGTGLGGVLALLITATSASDHNTPLFSASDARDFLFSNISNLFRVSVAGRVFLRRKKKFSPKSFSRTLQGVFRNLTLRDTCKPVLVPCYDLNSSAPFVFSRADASRTPSFDFELVDVCNATSATPGLFRPYEMSSIDKKTRCVGMDGGLVMNNPTAAAVTHVMHNKREFPTVESLDDLLLLSIGNGKSTGTKISGEGRSNGGNVVMEILFRGVSDTVDQILANAFCWNPNDYVRIQANGLTTETKNEPRAKTPEALTMAGVRMLGEIGVESLPFGGKQLLTETNGERIEAFVRRLVTPCSAVSTVVEPLLLLPLPEKDDGVTEPEVDDSLCR